MENDNRRFNNQTDHRTGSKIVQEICMKKNKHGKPIVYVKL